MEEPYISRRIYSLESFLNGIAINKELRSNEAFKRFLVSDKKLFQSFRHKIDKEKNPLKVLKDQPQKYLSSKLVPPISTLKYTDPNIECQNTPVYSNFIYCVSNLIDHEKPIRDSMNQDLLEIVEIGRLMANKLKEVSSKFSNLEDGVECFNRNSAFGKCPNLESMYSVAASHFKNMTDYISDFVEITNETLIPWTEYRQQELEGQALHLKDRLYVGSVYQRNKADLKKKKINIIRKGDTAAWGLDLKKLDLTKEKLMVDEKLAMELVLPEETQRLSSQQAYVGHYNVKMKEDMTLSASFQMKNASVALGEHMFRLVEKTSVALHNYQQMNKRLCKTYSVFNIPEM